LNHGFKVPDDISIIEMGDSEAVQHCAVPLTVMNERPLDIGRTAGDMMNRILEGEEIPNRLVKLSARLVERQSTSPPKSL